MGLNGWWRVWVDLASVTGNDTGGIFQVIKRLNPRVKWIIAVSITLTISGICILASFGVVGIHSKKSGFGTDESKSLQEEVVDGARKPTFYPSAIGTEAFTSGLQTYKPSFSPTSTNNPSKPKMTINPSAKPALPEPNQEKINPSALPTFLPLLLQGSTLSSIEQSWVRTHPHFNQADQDQLQFMRPTKRFRLPMHRRFFACQRENHPQNISLRRIHLQIGLLPNHQHRDQVLQTCRRTWPHRLKRLLPIIFLHLSQPNHLQSIRNSNRIHQIHNVNLAIYLRFSQ